MKTSRLYIAASTVGPLRRYFCLCACMMLIPAALWAQQPQQLLVDMGDAIERLNYKGTLVYMRSTEAETFRVYQRVVDNQATEKVIAINGDGVEIIRTPEEVICVLPEQRKVIVEKRSTSVRDQSPLRASLPKISPAITTNYLLQIVEEDRVADRPALLLSIDPKDEYRYGYRLWIDTVSSMPLKIQLLDSATGIPVEELFFTSISLPDVLDEALVQPGSNSKSFKWIRRGYAIEPGNGNELSSSPISKVLWRAGSLPNGFMETVATLEYREDSINPRTHLVYSDGLASVSVFVDAGVAASEQAEGLTTVGATNAYSRMIDGFLITAMGEVPAQTVQLIAASMELQP